MRNKILYLHLLLASFMAPAFILVAISGGLYLVGIKGSVTETDVALSNQLSLQIDSPQLEQDVRSVIRDLGLKTNFEYLKIRGSTLITRPTSRDHLQLKITDDGLQIKHINPDLQNSLMELHKGHGPILFKIYQKFFAVSLIFVMLSGLWMGLSNRVIRKKTLTATMLGLATFVILAIF